MSKKKRRKRNRGPSNTNPQTLFDIVVADINRLIQHHRAKWPDGVNPAKMSHPTMKQLGPVIRAYNNGVRDRSLYGTLLAIKELLVDE